MEFLKEIKTMLLIMGGFYLVVGLIMLLAPNLVSNAISYLIGTICLILGGLAIYTYIGSEVYGPLSMGMLVSAIIFITIGVFIIASPELLAKVIPFVMGIIIVIDAFSELQSANTLKKYGYNKWWTVLISGLLLFIFGILLLVNPFDTLLVFIRILGAFILIDGISRIVTALSYSKIEKAIQ